MVGHSYIVYGPLIAGMATILYEGLPIRPDAGIWWSLVEKYKVTAMFSAPTAVRVLKKQDPAFLKKYDLSSLRALFLAGEPLDEPTATWIAEAPGQADHRQLLADRDRLADPDHLPTASRRRRSKFGSPGVPMYGYDVKLIDETTGEELTGANQKGVVAIEGPLPPGCMQTVWRDDDALRQDLLEHGSRAARSTAPSTGASATRTATTSSSAAPTTSSTSPATGWARARSRRASPATPTWPRWRWSAWPTR